MIRSLVIKILKKTGAKLPLNIKGDSAQDVVFGLEMLARFVNLPVITDSFKNASERNAFEDKLYNENRAHYDFLKNNKLEGNNILSINNAFELIKISIDETDLPDPVKAGIKSLADKCPKYDHGQYDPLNVNGKLEYIKRFEDVIKEVFRLLRQEAKEK